MSDAIRRQPPDEAPKRGEAAWRAARDAIAKRNEEASKRARARRHEEYLRISARERAAELRERELLAKRGP